MTDRQLVNQNDATGAADYAQMAQASLARAQAAWQENAAGMTGLPVEWSPASDDAEVFVDIVAQAALNAVTGGASSFRSAAATTAKGAKGAFNTLDIASTVHQETRRPKNFGPFEAGKQNRGRQIIGPADYADKRDLAEQMNTLDGSLAGIAGLRRGLDQPPSDTRLMQQIRRRLEEPAEDLKTDSVQAGRAIPEEVRRLVAKGDERVRNIVEDSAPKIAVARPGL